MIEIINGIKIYKVKDVQTPALRGLNLHVDVGEFVAIMGPSGCGKSTLLNILGGMDTLTSGVYKFNGETVPTDNVRELHAFRRDHVSFVFQNFALIPYYTVYENVVIPLTAKGVKPKERKQIVMEKLEYLGIADLAKKLPIHISGGQQQRCAIARALAAGNELLLADEPTGALDSDTAAETMELLRGLNKEGKTIIVITHDSNVASYATRTLHMLDGVIQGA